MSNHNTNRQSFVTFELGTQQYAIASDDVERVTAMAEVDCPPNSPKLLVGFLNLADTAVPVIRLNSLFHLPEAPVRLWTPLVIVRTPTLRFALLVDKVNQVLVLDDDAVLPLPPGHALNDCVEGIVRSGANSVLVLSTERLLLQQEGQAIADLQQLAEQRMRDLQGVEA